MRKFPALPVGYVSGRLTVISEEIKRSDGKYEHLCRCSCGVEKHVLNSNLRNNLSTSCGCLTLENSVAKHRTHGRTGSGEYLAWTAMKSRCYYPGHIHWDRYGGRGIKVCDRWLNSFENFYADMGRKPSPKHSLDRINVDGDYGPENCRWATTGEQALNRSDNRLITAFGVTHPLKIWAGFHGIKAATISARLDRGWDAETAITKQPRKWGR